MSDFPFITFDNFSNTYSIAVGVSISDLNEAVTFAEPGAVFQFESGAFILDEVFYIKRSDILFQGAGGADNESAQTEFIVSDHLTNDAIVIKGEEDSSFQTQLIQTNAQEGAYQIEVFDGSVIQAGDILHIQQDNYSDDFLEDPIYSNIVDLPATEYSPLRETIAEVESINGNIITLKQPLAYDVNAGLTKITKISALENVEFTGFKISYNLPGVPDDDLFQNPLSTFKSSAAISIRQTLGIKISDINIENAASHGLEINDSLGAHIDGLTVDGAWNKGGGGNGYALHIKGTSHSTFENLTITDTRHAVVFSSWSAETDNEIHVLFTNRDINYHGSADHSNHVVVDVIDYDANEDKAWSIIDTGGDIHPYTNIYDNTTLFTYASAGDRGDIIFGTHNGSTLLGRSGDDTLIGGDGDDFLTGGEDNDILTGGTGADHFYISFNHGEDIITDFSAGDKIYIQNYYGLNNFDDIHITQNGDDTLVTLSAYDETYNSVTLKNYNSVSLAANDVVFENAATVIDTSDRRWTSLWDFIKTGDGDDYASGYFSDLTPDDILDMGEGRDTIEFISSSYNFDARGFDNIKGVDIIDARLSSRPRFILTDDLLSGTDNESLEILHGDAGIERLDTSLLSTQYQVILNGVGDVFLAHGGNTINVAEQSTGDIFGGTGDDVIMSASLSSKIYGELGDDTLIGQDNSDNIFYGGSDNDLLDGQGGNDILYGESGNDTIIGGEGNDIIIGGEGDDILQGDVGADVFQFSIEDGHDTITDFSVNDIIILQNYYSVEDFSDIYFEQNGMDTIITMAAYDGAYNSITLKNYSAENLFAENFGFVQNPDEPTSVDFKWTSLWDYIHGGDGDDTAYGYFSDLKSDDVINLGSGYDVIQFLTTNYSFDAFNFNTLTGVDEIDATKSIRARFDITENFVANTDNGVLKIRYDVSGIERLNTNTVLNTQIVELEGNGDVYLDNLGNNSLRFLETSNGMVYGGMGDDYITNYSNNIEIFAGDGNDTLMDVGANDIFWGGNGIDTVVYSNFYADYTILEQVGGLLVERNSEIDQLTDVEIILFGDGSYNTISKIFTPDYFLIEGTSNDDSISGTENFDLIWGREGNDYIAGRESDDEIYGGVGNDTLVGGAGDDVILGEEDNDFIKGGLGSDELLGALGDDIIFGDEGEDIIFGAEGHDILYGDSTIDDGWGGDDKIYGGAGQDIIYGSRGNDYIEGGDDIDSIQGGYGNDEIHGGGGDDNPFLTGNPASAGLQGGRGDDIIHGGDGHDWISGGRNNDHLYGDTGNDIIEGGEAQDLLWGGLGDDILKGDEGNDILYGEEGNDLLRGHANNDQLYGGVGNDQLEGYSGNDALIGGAGEDTLYGYSGWDRFFFDLESMDGNVDYIMDFSTTEYEKIIVLEEALEGYNPITSSIADFITFSNNGTHSNIFVDRDGTESFYSSEQIATVYNISDLSYGNNIRIEQDVT